MSAPKLARVRFAAERVEALLDDGLITVDGDCVVKHDEIRDRPGATVAEIPMGPNMYSAWVANLHTLLGSTGLSSSTLIVMCLRRAGFFDQTLTTPARLLTPMDLRLILSAQPVIRAKLIEEKRREVA